MKRVAGLPLVVVAPLLLFAAGGCKDSRKDMAVQPKHEPYQAAEVFCFPTLCDTYGIALLEAMSCGCAALVSDVAEPALV